MNTLKQCTLALALFAACVGSAIAFAQDAATQDQVPPAEPQTQPMPQQPAQTTQTPPPAAAATGQVTVKSVEPNSIVGDYKIDFDALDKNHDGCISRAEAKANATLTAEFRAVDEKHKGCLDKQALAGWIM